MKIKIYQSLLLVVAMIFFSTTAFTQTGSIRPSYSTPIPSGPLCMMLFKDKYYIIESHLVDSLVNPKAIKSLIVEKDAKATALYGARAANGLVLMVIEDKMMNKEFKRLKSYLTKF